jgi:hypothetical protein
MSADYRRGQKVYLTRMGLDGLYEVIPGTVVRIDPDGTVFVRIRIEPKPGPGGSVVIDVAAKDVCSDRRSAVLATARRCREQSRRWADRAFALLELLFQPGP